MKILKISSFVILFCFMANVVSAITLSDISEHPNETAIQYLYDNGVIQGYPDGTFRPEDTVKRGELIKILVKFVNYRLKVVGCQGLVSKKTPVSRGSF